MKNFILLLFINFHLCLTPSYANATDSINLIKNGDFEKGNKEFESDFNYNPSSLEPGNYSITYKASQLNSDLKDPINIDQKYKWNQYMVVNSDDQKNKRAWYTRVKVIPNSNYRFTVYFCNLYKKQGSNSGFMLNGIQIDNVPMGNDPNIKVLINKKTICENERDLFHVFKWLKAEGVWYSGTNTEAEISIENTNSRSLGNDLALDDIGLYYLGTMPEGYTEPILQTELSAEYREQEAQKNRPDPRKVLALNNLSKGDSITSGIHIIKQTPYTIPDFDSENGNFRNILFEQAKSEFSKEAIDLMDQLITYLNKHPQTQVKLKGHTDNVGNPDLNLKLSEERALLVKEYLIKNKISVERIEIQSFGGTHPIEKSTNEELYKLNRRVEIEIIKP